jgi:FkbM family methyltransferase
VTPKRLYAHYRARRELRRRACEPELKLLPFLVDRERCSVDVGANRGSYTYFLARLSRRVFAYEPNPAMRRYLQGASLENVVISEKALSDRSGAAEFRIPFDGRRYGNNVGSLETLPHDSSECLRITVPTARLDDEPIEDVGFIKIDVEGHEQAVLAGARHLIERDRPVLLVEILPVPDPGHVRQTIEQIESLGYQPCIMQQDRLTLLGPVSNTEPAARPGSGPAARPSNNVLFLPTKARAA